MRITKFVLLLLFIMPIMSHAQIAPTTVDEYNIGSVGYKMLLTMKVDLKAGYKVINYDTYEYADRKAEFKGLLRDGENKPCAMIMVYQKLRGAPEYYCIPTPDAPEALWDRFRISLTGETDSKQEQMQFFAFVFAKAMMYFSGK
ncbi:MAG: hypothetical protein ABI772_15495 [Bacteroidota bacterium]